MVILNRRFRPTLWPTLAAAALLPLLLGLGIWQYGRAQEKDALEARFADMCPAFGARFPIIGNNEFL